MAYPELTPRSTNVIADESSGLEATINRIESKLDKLISWQQDIISEVKGIQNTLAELQTTSETLADEQQQLRTENFELRKQVEWNEIEIDRLKQQRLSKCFEISNVPVAEGENLLDITTCLCREIGVTIGENDVQEIFRTPSNLSLKSQIPPSIHVKVFTKTKRDEVLTRKREKRDLTTGILNTSSNNTQNSSIYINEVLTKRNRYLFKLARDVKRKGKIKFAWFKDGRLLVRKTEKAKVIDVTSEKTLNDYSK